MKVLIVCSGNVPGDSVFDFKVHQAFIFEQIEELKTNFAISYSTFFIQGHGLRGYLNNLAALKKKIKEYDPDIVHAHYATSAFLTILQKAKPFIVTFHGSDINNKNIRPLSAITMIFSKWNIFVSKKLFYRSILKFIRRSSVIPCGIDLRKFYPVDKPTARRYLQWDPLQKIVLFCSSFNNPVKNSKLALSAMALFSAAALIEIKNKSRTEVNHMLNGCDVLLLTSFSEGSPQIIKEAMACNCPIVATDVGDIRELLGSTEGCYLTNFNQDDVASKIALALDFGKRTNGREAISRFNNEIIAAEIYEVYRKVLGI